MLSAHYIAPVFLSEAFQLTLIYVTAEREHKDDDEKEVLFGDQGAKRQWQKAAKTITTQQQVSRM